MVDWLKNFLFRVMRPSFWIQNYRSCAATDTLLTALMDADVPVRVRGMITVLGCTEVWTSNWPYAYGQIQSMDHGMPSALVRVRLRNYIAAKVAEQEVRKSLEVAQ